KHFSHGYQVTVMATPARHSRAAQTLRAACQSNQEIPLGQGRVPAAFLVEIDSGVVVENLKSGNKGNLTGPVNTSKHVKPGESGGIGSADARDGRGRAALSPRVQAA